MILRKEVKITGGSPSYISLLPCRATGSSEFDDNYVFILVVHRGAKDFIVEIASAD
jgi:hypothetical protein